MFDTNQMKSVKGWVKTAVIAGVGGGIAGAFAAAMNPAEYQFPHDFGSGKLWKFFGQGFFLTFGALVLKSPFGQKIVGSFKDAQAELKESQTAIADAKADLKGSTTPPKK
jgi:hypothetical protein